MLKALELPRDAREIMKLNEDNYLKMEKEIKRLYDEGEMERNKVPIELDPRNIRLLAHWVAKTITPIEKPEDEEVEAHFVEFLKCRHDIVLKDEGKNTIKMSIVGDLMATPNIEKSKDVLYEHISDIIFDSDIIHGNLESTLTTENIDDFKFTAEETPKVNITEEQYNSVISHKGRKYDIVTLANNHILDCGDEGIQTTATKLKEDRIRFVGINESEEERYNPFITEIAGLKTGWVTETWSVNFREFPKGKPWRVNMTPFHSEKNVDVSHIIKGIEKCKKVECDLIVVTLHWGIEHEMYPRKEQMRWAKEFAEAGADIVIGHHPHVAQVSEVVTTLDGRKVPILYSLGNLTPMMSCPAMAMSLVAEVEIVKGRKEKGEKTYIRSVKMNPVAIVADKDGLPVLYKVKDLINIVDDDNFEMIEYVNKIVHYVEVVLGKEWKENDEKR